MGSADGEMRTKAVPYLEFIRPPDFSTDSKPVFTAIESKIFPN